MRIFFLWKDSFIFNIWAASNSEIRVFFPSIYSSRGSHMTNLHSGLLCSDPENPGGREMTSTETALTGREPVWLLVQSLALGWYIPPQQATLPRRKGQQGNVTAVIWGILLLLCLGHIILKSPCDEQRCQWWPLTRDGDTHAKESTGQGGSCSAWSGCRAGWAAPQVQAEALERLFPALWRKSTISAWSP